MKEYSYGEMGVEIRIDKGDIDGNLKETEKISKAFKRCLEIHKDNKIFDEFKVTSGNEFNVEFWFSGKKVFITHMRAYKKGYGTKVIKSMEESYKNCFEEISIQIGTEKGEKRTKEFLRKNGFKNLSKMKTSIEWSDAITGQKEI